MANGLRVPVRSHLKIVTLDPVATVLLIRRLLSLPLT